MKKIKTIGILGCLLVLTLSFVSAAIIWDDDSTSVTLIGMGCPEPKDGWIDAITDPPIKYNTIAKGEERIYDCREPIGDPLLQACCPGTSICKPAPSGMIISPIPGYFLDNKNYTCQASSELYCSDFTNEYDCANQSTYAIAERSIENMPGISEGYCGNITGWVNGSGALCSNETLCSCEWDAVTSICTARQAVLQNCSGVTKIVSPPDDCYWDITNDNGCELGQLFMHVIWTYVDVDGDGSSGACGDSWEADIDCGDVVKLNFFTLINVIAAIAIIGIIYYFYANRNKKKKKRGR